MTPVHVFSPYRNVILTGFMGVGKSAVGRIVAERLGRPFVDTDERIEERAGKSIPVIFATQGETAFRQMETELCRELSGQQGLVISTGGGMLIPPANRLAMEASGRIICLRARAEVIVERLAGNQNRPLLAEADPVATAKRILQEREPLYASFEWGVDTSDRTPAQAAEEVLRLWEARRLEIRLPAPFQATYPIHIEKGSLVRLGEALNALGLRSRLAVVSNTTVWPLYGERLSSGLEQAGFTASPCLIPDGEEYKTLDTVAGLYQRFLDVNIERQGAVIALGGGVVGDIAGFAAATFLRGVPIVHVPTTLLAMIDSSVGGKTGVDLPEGKNLVGAFHHPRLVGIDPAVLASLPERQLGCGLAEALKAGLIGDVHLFNLLQAGPPWPWVEIIERALAVKIGIVEEDPEERGRRAVLNLGHTAGHALERLSAYILPHGEAVAIGMLIATRISAELGSAPAGLPAQIAQALRTLGLPTTWSGPASPADVLHAMAHDKKRRDGRLRWVLPVHIGQVRIADEVPDRLVLRALEHTRAEPPETGPEGEEEIYGRET